jgi:phospholipase C
MRVQMKIPGLLPSLLGALGAGIVALSAVLLLRPAADHPAALPAVSRTTPAQLSQARAKIKHVVFVLLENHSYDSIFGRFPGGDGATTASVAGKGTIDLLHAPAFGWHDIDHGPTNAAAAIDGGKMDGFAKNNGADLYGDQMAFEQFSQSDVPNFWRYAQQYALGDHMFSSAAGTTFPNHLFAVAAQTGGVVGNPHYWQVGWG